MDMSGVACKPMGRTQRLENILITRLVPNHVHLHLQIYLERRTERNYIKPRARHCLFQVLSRQYCVINSPLQDCEGAAIRACRLANGFAAAQMPFGH